MIEYWKELDTISFRGEIWVDIINFPDYKISNFGRVKSLKRSNSLILKQKDIRGYKSICLRNKEIKKSLQIHRLVAIAFIDNEKNKPTVNHKNLKKYDNTVENLEWATHKEQSKHSWEFGNRNQSGEKNPNSNLNDEMVFNILKMGKFGSWSLLEDYWNIPSSTLWNIIKRKTWKHIKI